MVKTLFILLLVIFPLGQLGRVEVGGGVAILLNDVAVFLVVGSWLLHKVQKQEFPKNRLAVPIAPFTGAALLSLLFRIGELPTQHLMISSLYLIRWVTYAGLFFVVMDFDERFKHKALYGLLLAGFATALLGLAQYFLYPDLRNLYYAGWDEHLYRLFSSFLDPNFAGGIFTLTFLVALSLSRGVSFITPPRWNRGYTSGISITALLTAVISFIALLLTYSRGSFLSFIAGIVTFLLIQGRRKLIIFALIAFGLGVFFLPKNLQSEGVALLRTASITARVESAQNAIAIFQDNPFFGVGFNTYRYAQRERGFLADEDWEQVHSGAGTDNSFLFVLATTGIVGLFAYLYLWMKVIGVMRGNPLIIASLIALFVHALFVNSLFYPHIMEWLWIFIAASRVRT